MPADTLNVIRAIVRVQALIRGRLTRMKISALLMFRMHGIEGEKLG